MRVVEGGEVDLSSPTSSTASRSAGASRQGVANHEKVNGDFGLTRRCDSLGAPESHVGRHMAETICVASRSASCAPTSHGKHQNSQKSRQWEQPIPPRNPADEMTVNLDSVPSS